MKSTAADLSAVMVMAEIMMSNFFELRAGMMPSNGVFTTAYFSPIASASALPRSMSKPVAVVDPTGKNSCGGYETSDPTVRVPAVNSPLSGGGLTLAVPDGGVLEDPQAASRMAAASAINGLRAFISSLSHHVTCGLLPEASTRGESARAAGLTQLVPPVSLSSGAVTGRRSLAVLGIGLIGSQAGHLLAYQVRFGAAAQQLQSSGAHAYFPAVIRAGFGVAATLLLAAVFVIGLARVLGGRSVRRSSAPPYLRLAAVLFTIQLVAFAGQEVGEALAAGMPVDSAAHLLLWGTLGQLPVAVMAAAGLRWLLTRVESAATLLHIALASIPRQISPTGIAVSVWVSLDRGLVFKPATCASLAKRGPPSSLRVSSY